MPYPRRPDPQTPHPWLSLAGVAERLSHLFVRQAQLAMPDVIDRAVSPEDLAQEAMVEVLRRHEVGTDGHAARLANLTIRDRRRALVKRSQWMSLAGTAQ